MLDNIDKNQRYKLKRDSLSLPSPERHRALRHQMSTDNMNVPPFNIPNLRVEKRKTSSAEDMARKNSTSGPSAPTIGGSMGGFKGKCSIYILDIILWSFLLTIFSIQAQVSDSGSLDRTTPQIMTATSCA